MKALQCVKWGLPEELVLAEVPSPIPSDGEVLIRVHACGLNFADTLMIAGRYQDRPPLPFIPGFELSGDVLDTGAGVDHVKSGDRVAAWCNYGAYAEEVVVPAQNSIPIPDNIDYASAAAFTIAYGTSHLALDLRARLRPGEVLLVHGAAGGVGLTAVELGKLTGATVIACASTAAKLEVAGRYRADHLINYLDEDFPARVNDLTNGRGADVIYDPVGGDTFDHSLRCINLEGRIIAIGFAGGRIPKMPVNVALLKNISLVGAYWGGYANRRPDIVRQSLRKLLEWAQQGKLRPHVSKIYPFEEAISALNALSRRESTGRLVLNIRGS